MPNYQAQSQTNTRLNLEIGAHFDEVPYPRGTYSQTHPDYLATLARLLGLEPAPVQRCRVLEIGCAGGGNLLPMAWGLPDSEFVGIDLSAKQISVAKANVQALGLENLTFRWMDIMDVRPEFGEFDYIIAHGVYSWVPTDVRDKLLAICRQNLAPQGVAYVSYNVYPGWHVLGAMRDMMLFHTRGVADRGARASAARGLLEFLVESGSASTGTTTYVRDTHVKYMRYELERIKEREDSALLHDELEIVNDPVYFHQFVEHAARHELQFLSEARFALSKAERVPEAVQAGIASMSDDVVEQEQYLDFLLNATFRRTLLCHGHVALERNVSPDGLRAFHFASPARAADGDADLHAEGPMRFVGSDESSVSTNHPLSKGAMVCLREHWPRALSFDELLQRASACVSANGAGVEAQHVQMMQATLAQSLTYSERLMRIHTYAPEVGVRAVNRPRVSALSLLEAQHGDVVTNAYHQTAHLDKLTKYLLPYIDGTYDKAALTDVVLAGPVAEGTLQLLREDEPVADRADVADSLAAAVSQRVDWLAENALLAA